MWKIMELKFVVLFVFLVKETFASDNETYHCNEIPKLPYPKYTENGDILWFPRIIGGTPATLGEFTGKVSIQNRMGSHFCGGTIIHLTHVLTAAHCLTNSQAVVADPLTVQLMGDSVSIKTVTAARQIRLAQLFFVHPAYNPNTMLNDIAVIRVATPFLTTNTLIPVQRTIFTPVAGTVCSVAGWGATEENGPASPILMRVDVNIITRTACNAPESYNGFIQQGMICAGVPGGGRDACQGDSGGGLICNNVLSGVVSFGVGCGQPNFPGVYADVSVYNGWIESTFRWHGGGQDQVPRPPVVGGSNSRQNLSLCLMFIVVFITKYVN